MNHMKEHFDVRAIGLVLLMLAGSAQATVTDFATGLNITEETTITGVTNRYNGKPSAIRANLTLDNYSYLRLVGSTTEGSNLSFGPASDQSAVQCPVVTIKNRSGLYATYRNTSGFLDDTGSAAVKSCIAIVIGENGGEGRFVVQTTGSKFGTNIARFGLWAERLFIHANATTSSDTLDFLQIDQNGAADITYIENDNAKPARILFNGGTMYDNYVNASYGSQLSPARDKTIILEGINGNPVRIQKEYQVRRLNGGAGTVRFQGACDVVFTDAGNNLPGIGNDNRREYTIDPSPYGPIEWRQTGDLVLSNQCFLACNASNVLPCGTDTGIVRMKANAILDINGTTQNLRSLVSESNLATVTNAIANKVHNSVISTIVFGTNDTDGVFSAKCCDNVNVEKIGAGTLVVSNVTVEGTLTVRAGRVLLTGENHIGEIVCADGAMIDAMVQIPPTEDSIKTIQTFPQAGGYKNIFEKKGADTLLVRAGANLDGLFLDVQNGRLQFTGDVTDKWWRLVLLKAANVSTNSYANSNHVELNMFSLFPSNITTSAPNTQKKHLNYGLVTNMSGTAWTSYAQMPAGTCTEGFGETYNWNPTAVGRVWWGVDTLCTNMTAAVFLTTGNPAISESTPRHIVYRLKDDAPPVSSYAIGMTQWSRYAAAEKWRVESSVDGIEWTVRDAHTAKWANTSGMSPAEARATSEIPNFTFSTDGCYNNNVPYRFTAGAAASECLRNVTASVAAGATLDTAYIQDSSLSFAALEVDCAAGGGTLTKFAPAPNGALYLKNLPGGLTARYIVPLTLTETVGAENLASWTVYVDGTPVRGRYVSCAADGSLTVKRRAFTISVR